MLCRPSSGCMEAIRSFLSQNANVYTKNPKVVQIRPLSELKLGQKYTHLLFIEPTMPNEKYPEILGHHGKYLLLFVKIRNLPRCK